MFKMITRRPRSLVLWLGVGAALAEDRASYWPGVNRNIDGLKLTSLFTIASTSDHGRDEDDATAQGNTLRQLAASSSVTKARPEGTNLVEDETTTISGEDDTSRRRWKRHSVEHRLLYHEEDDSSTTSRNHRNLQQSSITHSSSWSNARDRIRSLARMSRAMSSPTVDMENDLATFAELL
ncbi:unnamed protein product, partial [Amoebophrya sp. A25]|eukprot:GSA25T00025063001.1